MCVNGLEFVICPNKYDMVLHWVRIFWVNVLKFRTLSLFSSRMLVIRAGIHKMLVRIGNREDPEAV